MVGLVGLISECPRSQRKRPPFRAALFSDVLSDTKDRTEEGKELWLSVAAFRAAVLFALRTTRSRTGMFLTALWEAARTLAGTSRPLVMTA